VPPKPPFRYPAVHRPSPSFSVSPSSSPSSSDSGYTDSGCTYGGCIAGTYAGAGASSCLGTLCAPGTYGPAGATSATTIATCVNCPAGGTPCPSKVVALTIARPAPRAVPCHLVAAHSASPPQAHTSQQLAPQCVSTAAQASFRILSALTGLTPALILASAPFVPSSIMAASSLRCVCTRWHLGSYLGP